MAGDQRIEAFNKRAHIARETFDKTKSSLEDALHTTTNAKKLEKVSGSHQKALNALDKVMNGAPDALQVGSGKVQIFSQRDKH